MLCTAGKFFLSFDDVCNIIWNINRYSLKLQLMTAANM